MKKLLFTLALLSAAASGWAQCSASFLDTIQGTYSMGFYNTSDTSSNMVYYWSFPGGTPSSDTTTNISSFPVVSYGASGTYTACLVTVDTVQSCIDSFCATFTFYSNSITPGFGGNDATCGNCNGTLSVSPSGGTAPYSYLWSTGSTSASMGGLCAGTYTVTITDYNGAIAVANHYVAAISSSMSASVTVSNPTPCHVESITLQASATGGTSPYTYLWQDGSPMAVRNSGSADGLYICTITDSSGCSAVDSVLVTRKPEIFFNDSSIAESCLNCCDGAIYLNASGGSGSGYQYQWSTGATTSSITNLCPGTYLATVTDGNGCTQAWGLGVQAYTCYAILGNVAQGGNARVYLIEENSGSLSAVDSVTTSTNGGYTFYQVCPGTYYVKAALLPAHSQYSNYLPTYYDSVALWANADSINMGFAHVYNIDFSLIQGSNSGGPGFVGGLISQGANRAEGDPVANAQVILFNENGSVAAFTRSDANGEYSFDDIALGSYTIHVDMLNRTSIGYDITLNAETQELLNRNFEVNSDMIRPETTTGIDAVSNQRLTLYPNPVSDRLYIQSLNDPFASYVVYDLLGSKVMEGRLGASSSVEIVMEDLQNGQYIIQVIGDAQTRIASFLRVSE